MRSTEARVYLTPRTEEARYLPEGPRVMGVAGRDALVWANIQRATDSLLGDIFVHPLDSPDDFAVPAPDRPGFILPCAGGERALVGAGKSLLNSNLVSRRWSLPIAVIPDTNARTIINDGEIVPGGKAVVFGTKDLQFRDPIANLYLYTVDDNRMSLLADGQTCSNGKVFAADAQGLILFDIDTPRRNVVRYRIDISTRMATPDGIALDLAGEAGFPDGMCDCGDGTVIVAFYNPDLVATGRAVRFDLGSGKAVEEWTTIGSPRVTCPLLIKQADGVKLILTTATEGMPAEMRVNCPNAGCLFIADTQLTTCPEPEVVRSGS